MMSRGEYMLTMPDKEIVRVRTQLRLSYALHEILRKAAFDSNVSINEIVTIALQKYFADLAVQAELQRQEEIINAKNE